MTAELLERAVCRPNAAEAAAMTMVSGRVVGQDPSGAPLVDWPGNGNAPRVAGWLGGAWPPTAPLDGHGAEALLLIGPSGDDRPILAGVIHRPQDGLTVPLRLETQTRGFGARVVLDGNALTLEARESVTLRCGESSITLRSDGKVVVRGRRVVSRADETNAIRGGQVRIN